MTNTLPAITTKQKEILRLIYTYRFLNRTQIQTLLKHKDKRRIISWLKDLREKQYLDWHYDATDFKTKSQPAIYYLALNGIRHLRQLDKQLNEELRKRYKDSDRQQVFINRCLLIADCVTALYAKSHDDLKYTCVLPAEYVVSDYPFNELKPQLYFTKQQDDEIAEYFLEFIDQHLPRYRLRQRLNDYMDYLASLDHRIITLIICPTVADLVYVKRRWRIMLEDCDSDELVVRLTTIDKVRAQGVTNTIWEDVQ